MTEQEVYIIDSTRERFINWKELWCYRELFYFFTWRDLKVKYKQTFLGIFWVMLQPLIMVLIFTYFFGRMLGVASDGIPYTVFALSGVIFWNFFSASVSNAGNSMVLNSPIIKKIYFPRLIIPISSILAAWIDFVIAFILFVILLIYYSVGIDWVLVILLWPLAFLLTIVASVGLGCWLSALMVKYRDFRFIVGFALQIGFFLTPIVYPISQIDFIYAKYALALNPMYGPIALFREPLMATTSDAILILVSTLSSLLCLFFGLAYFKRTELYFADLS